MGRRVSFFHRLVALPLPPLLDSGLRRNDELGTRRTKRGRPDCPQLETSPSVSGCFLDCRSAIDAGLGKMGVTDCGGVPTQTS